MKAAKPGKMMKSRDSKRLVLKTGSSLITGEDGKLRAGWLATVAEDIAALIKEKKEVIVVSSGAVALGRNLLGLKEKNLKLEEKQAAAAAGQPLLMRAWREALERHGLKAAQMLLTIDDSEHRRRYLNARSTLETLLELGVVPIINENDTVATAELRFGDNDRLAARVAQMASADTLILLSDIEGLYSANPKTNKNATFIEEVKQITPEIEAMAGGVVSSVGSGGMITKIMAAKIALHAGCHMAIAEGLKEHPLRRVMAGEKATWFISSSTPKSARKHWIAGSINPTGALIVDEGASKALASGKSLLPAGVKSLEGRFSRGDTVAIKDLAGVIIGRGLVAYDREEAEKIIGHKSEEIEKNLGYKGRDTIIHRDDMVLSE